MMRKYQIEHPIGNGNFSNVFKAVLYPEKIICAIKIMKTHDTIATRQAQILKKFKHPNIVSIIDFEQTQGQSRLFLEYVGINTLELYEAQSFGLREEQVKCILFQAALALSCVHSMGIIHRDIKPENIIIDKKGAIVKLIDFGLSIEDYKCTTDYIATRWYRSPENLLGTRQYTCAIDIFSLGCVIVELYLGSPLFPGTNNIDQIHKILNILGYPTAESWPKGYQKMRTLGIKDPNREKNQEYDLKSIMNTQDSRLVEIVERMLSLNPKKRITATEILKHQYFKDIKSIVPPAVYKIFETDVLKKQQKLYIPKGSFGSRPKRQSSGLESSPKKYAKAKAQLKNRENSEVNDLKNKNGEVPLLVRQNKSSSLDCLNKSEGLVKKMVLKDTGSGVQYCLKKKASTPALILNMGKVNKSPHTSAADTPRVPSIFKQQKYKFPKGNETDKVIDGRQQNQIILEQNTIELQSSKITPDGSQTTLSQFSKIMTPTSLPSENLSSFYQTQLIRNKIYPVVPNPQFGQEDSQLAKHARKIASPITMSQTQDKHQKVNMSIQTNSNQVQTPPPTLSTGFPSLYSPIMTQQFLKEQQSKKLISHHQVQQFPRMIEKIQIQQRKYQAKQPEIKLKVIQSPQILRDQTSPRIHYMSPTLNQRTLCVDHSTTYKPGNMETSINRQVMSPSHRYLGSSPDARQVRMMTAISPHAAEFKNLTHRKL